MKNLQWKMEETFYFPTNIGVPSDGSAVKVKAGFTEKRSDDSVRLNGIYHIAAQVTFDEGERTEELPEEVVYVDDVELDGRSGYFEYAVPLHVDLPPEVEQPLHIETTDVRATADGNGALTVAWYVNCSYSDASSGELAVKEVVEEKPDTATAELPPQEKTDVAQKQESLQATAEHVHEETVAMHDSSSWNDHDDILSYIAGLPDEWTTTSFRSNDVFVKQESYSTEEA